MRVLLGDEEQPDKKFGGGLQVGDVNYLVYASKHLVETTSSSKAPSPSPTPAGQGAYCYSDPKQFTGYHDFDIQDMYTLINQTCPRPVRHDNTDYNAIMIKDNGDLTLRISATATVTPGSWAEACVRNFTTAVDCCDLLSNRRYGSTINIQSHGWSAYARKTDTKLKDCSCSPKFSIPFRRPDMVNWIRDFCGPPNSFDVDFTQLKDGKPLAELNVHPRKGWQVAGFDEEFYTKGFQAAMDNCNKGKDKDKEDLWGGKCTLGDIVFEATAPKPKPPAPPKFRQ
ncbi:MAG: hypothetical protein Q9168_003751 [Polycauliona sp. 1 TL-2023]